MTLEMQSDLPAPPAPPSPHPMTARRWALFVAVTLASALLMAQHFASIPKTIAAQGGNKLSQAPLNVIDKVVLVSQWAAVRPYASTFVNDPEDTLSVYNDEIAATEREIERLHTDSTSDPIDRAPREDELAKKAASLRARYVVLLALLGDTAGAARVADALGAHSDNAPMAHALRDAFALDESGLFPSPSGAPGGAPSASPARREASSTPPPRPLPAHQAELDAKTLEGLAGWPGQAAQLALARRAHDTARAETLDASLQQEAQRLALQLAIIGGLFGTNFILGIIALFTWGVRGRIWNLRSTDIDLDHPQSDYAFDPLAGWSMLLAFQIVSPLVGTIAAGLLARGEGSVAAHGSAFLVVGVQLIIYAVMLGLIGAAIRFRWISIGLHARKLLRSALSGLGLFFGAFIAVLAASWFMSHFFHSSNAQNNPMFQIFEDSAGGQWQLIALLALVAIVGPFFEEILFRGAIYTSMRQVLPAAVAIPLNGLLFSAVHGDLNTLIPLATLGMMLAYGYERTRSLATSTVCHCLWNGQTFLLFFMLFS